jgi:hypothetical protein
MEGRELTSFTSGERGAILAFIDEGLHYNKARTTPLPEPQLVQGYYRSLGIRCPHTHRPEGFRKPACGRTTIDYCICGAQLLFATVGEQCNISVVIPQVMDFPEESKELLQEVLKSYQPSEV